MLDQAVTLKEARDQLDAFIELVRRLGVLQLETVYEANQFRYDFRLKLDR